MKNLPPLTIKEWAVKARKELYKFYWNSSPNSTHSKNIASNNNAFVVIYSKTEVGFGVYMLGKASRVKSVSELGRAKGLLLKRQGKNYADPSSFSGSVTYKFSPRKCWVNDEAVVKGKKIDVKIDITKEML